MPTFIRAGYRRRRGFGSPRMVTPLGGTRAIATYGGRRVRRRLFSRVGVRTGGRIFRAGWGGVAAGVAANLALGTRVHSTYMRRLKARRQVGLRIGSSNAKSEVVQPSAEVNASKTLNRVQRLLTLDTSTDVDDRSTRLQQSVDFRGVKICFRVQIDNVTNFGGQKFFFNWAIISPKQLDPTITAIPVEEFFRGHGKSNRAQDFSGTQTGLDLHCLPINTDKYIIHRHKRFIMGPYESTEGKSEKYFEMYVPVKRKIVYNQTGVSAELDMPEGKDMWMVWWGAFASEGNGTPLAGAYTTQFKLVKWFREPKSS